VTADVTGFIARSNLRQILGSKILGIADYRGLSYSPGRIFEDADAGPG
jgi:hypothetical protein